MFLVWTRCLLFLGLALLASDVGNAETNCYVSHVEKADDCESSQLCIKMPGHLFSSPEECETLAFLGDHIHHPIFTADEIACRMYVHSRRGCTKEAKPRHVMSDDIILTDEQYAILMRESRGGPSMRGSLGVWIRTWPKVGDRYVVPYVVDKWEEWEEKERDSLLWSMRWLEVNTVIRFKERSNEPDFLKIVEAGGCSSFMGFVGGEQLLNINKLCRFHHELGHEILHALGMGHEHQRPDRDEHIDVFMDHVKEGKEHNFNMNPGFTTDTPYDFASMMQYASWSFKKESGLITMSPKPGTVSIDIIDSRAASPTTCDFAVINSKYPGFEGGEPCSPNSFIRTCRATETCPFENCQDRCDWKCQSYLDRNFCELLFTTEELAEIVSALDGSPATGSTTKPPPPTIAVESTRPTLPAWTPPPTDAPAPTIAVESTRPTLPAWTPPPTDAPAPTIAVESTRPTLPAAKNCYANKQNVWWVSECDSEDVCLILPEIRTQQECTNFFAQPHSKWAASRFDCRSQLWKAGSCSQPPTDDSPWTHPPEDGDACWVSEVHHAEDCNDARVCKFDGRFKTEEACVKSGLPNSIWTHSSDGCRDNLYGMGGCSDFL